MAERSRTVTFLDPPQATVVVLDASVAYKWFVTAGEAGVDVAERLLNEHIAGSIQLVAPSLLAHELFGALARRMHSAEDLSESMSSFLDVDVTLIPPRLDEFELASQLVASGAARPADAAYAALALALDCELATSDMRLIRSLGDRIRIRAI